MPEFTVPQIYAALVNVSKSVGAIAKSEKNVQQGFKYRGIDRVMNALHPAFIEHGVLAIPTVLEKTYEVKLTSQQKEMQYCRMLISYRFVCAADGSSVEAVVVGEASDLGDKSSNKSMAIAFKYACFQVLCIPTEETASDADAESHQVTPTRSLANELFTSSSPNKPQSVKPVIDSISTPQPEAWQKAIVAKLALKYNLEKKDIAERARSLFSNPTLVSTDMTADQLDQLEVILSEEHEAKMQVQQRHKIVSGDDSVRVEQTYIDVPSSTSIY